MTECVKCHGAVGDGSTDDSAAIQSAVDAVPASGGRVVFPAGEYLCGTTVHLPPTTEERAVFEYVAEGCAVLRTESPIAIMDRIPTSQSGNLARWQPVFRGLHFKGTQSPGQVGLKVGGAYGALVEQCTFDRLEDGLDLMFCLMSAVRSSFAQLCTRHHFTVRSGAGEWSGATPSNSASNGSVFRSCRVYGSPGAETQFRALASSEVRFVDVICEGHDPAVNILIDDGGSTTAEYARVVNPHFENTPSVAHVKLVGGSGFRVFEQAGGGHVTGVQLDAGEFGNGYIRIDGLASVHSGELFNADRGDGKANGARWLIRWHDPNRTLTDQARWVGGVVGRYVLQMGDDGSDYGTLYSYGKPLDLKSNVGIEMTPGATGQTHRRVVVNGDVEFRPHNNGVPSQPNEPDGWLRVYIDGESSFLPVYR